VLISLLGAGVALIQRNAIQELDTECTRLSPPTTFLP
jgi:hypothetical protein